VCAILLARGFAWGDALPDVKAALVLDSLTARALNHESWSGAFIVPDRHEGGRGNTQQARRAVHHPTHIR
jgi:hypothetical protein